MSVDAKKLKQQLNSEQVIQIVKSLGGLVFKHIGQDSNEIVFYSCCHHLSAQEHNPKLYYFKDSKSFRCYSCSSSFDIYSLIQERKELEGIKNFGFIDALNYVLDITGIETSLVTRLTPIDKTIPWEPIFGKYARIEGKETSLRSYDKTMLDFFDERFPISWCNQGISIETMRLYSIRYYSVKNQTIIPCFDEDNNLVGIRVRNWNEDEDRKYDTLKRLDRKDYAFATNQVLYGLNFNKYAIERRKTVIIVESEKAVMKSDTWFGNNSIAVGTFGLSGWNLNITRRDMLLKLGISKVIIAPDYDYKTKASQKYFKWFKRQKALADKFKGFCDVEIIPNLNDLVPYKDNVFDVDRETFNKLFEEKCTIQQLEEAVNEEKKTFERKIND